MGESTARLRLLPPSKELLLEPGVPVVLDVIVGSPRQLGCNY